MHAPNVILSEDFPSFQADALKTRLQVLGSPEPWVVQISVCPETSQDLFPDSNLTHVEGFAAKLVTKGGCKTALIFGRTVRAALYGGYAVLEALGAPVLHPIRRGDQTACARAARWDLWPVKEQQVWVEVPTWEVRRWHYHTQHPLELCWVLQGAEPPHSRDFQDPCSTWEEMLPEAELFFEWCIANRCNQVQWILLEWDDAKWGGRSQARKQRLKEVVRRARTWQLEVSLDVPITLLQQHSFRMIRSPVTTWTLAAQLKEMSRTLDWVADLGVAHVHTEMGTTEFTAGDGSTAIRRLSHACEHLRGRHGIGFSVKVHCPGGQTGVSQEAEARFKDPRTGQALNRNFLVHYADKDVMVLAHTVQIYGLGDPAPTYGNSDWSRIHDFIWWQVDEGRPVVFFPETSYWVGYDVDVPVFLPVYAARRLADLRLLERQQQDHSNRLRGHCFFDSGWEWGYWVNNFVAARAMWDPRMDLPTDAAALAAMLAPIAHALGSPLWGPHLTDWCEAQHRLLIHGEVEGAGSWSAEAPGAGAEGDDAGADVLLTAEAPSPLGRTRSGPPCEGTAQGEGAFVHGMAYLQGVETWTEILWMLGTNTHPFKLRAKRIRASKENKRRFEKEVQPLLAAMDSTFHDLSNQSQRLLLEDRPRLAQPYADLAQDLVQSQRITHARADLERHLYEAEWHAVDSPTGQEHLRRARCIVDAAVRIVEDQESRYPIPRASFWGQTPTVYPHGYLWTVHSLLFFWRDLAVVERRCFGARWASYLNYRNPLEVVWGRGALFFLVRSLYTCCEAVCRVAPGLRFAIAWIGAPTREPVFPRDL